VLGATEMVVGYRLYLRHNADIVVLDLAMGQQRLAVLPLIDIILLHNLRAQILDCGQLKLIFQLRDE
jgi:hypothetical protein